MKLGNSNYLVLISFFIIFISNSTAEEKILSTPLINLEELKPSFEEEGGTFNDISQQEVIKNKKKLKKNTTSSIKLIGLDKITAKTSEIIINLGETKKFGQLEIKALKCGKLITENVNDNVAYIQVKDISENENDKIFIFNGWTFSSDPTVAPFDHAIYDLQLISCSKV